MTTTKPLQPCRIVILGGGFGGAYCAQALQRHLRDRQAEILLIDRHNYFVFYPLLVEAGPGPGQRVAAGVPGSRHGRVEFHRA